MLNLNVMKVTHFKMVKTEVTWTSFFIYIYKHSDQLFWNQGYTFKIVTSIESDSYVYMLNSV